MRRNQKFASHLIRRFDALPCTGMRAARLAYRIRRVLELRYNVIV